MKGVKLILLLVFLAVVFAAPGYALSSYHEGIGYHHASMQSQIKGNYQLVKEWHGHDRWRHGRYWRHGPPYYRDRDDHYFRRYYPYRGAYYHDYGYVYPYYPYRPVRPGFEFHIGF
jgi:hypothetical protein